MPTDAGPAYQWYAGDALSSPTIQKMTLEQEGCFRRLLDYQWLDGKISQNFLEIRALLKNVSRKRFEKIWAVIGLCFELLPDGSGLINPRLNYIREERIAFLAERGESGKKGANKRWKRDGLANGSAIRKLMANDSSSSPSLSIPPIVPQSSPIASVRIEYSTDFEKFWTVYPKKTGKGAAFTSWKKNGHPPLDQVIAIIQLASRSPKWLEQNGRFIPNPATWLNQKRWDDDYGPQQPAKRGVVY